MEKLAFFDKSNRTAIIGVILMIPALLLVCGGLLFSFFGISMVNDSLNLDLAVFHPIVILGGMAMALLLNMLSVLRFHWKDGALVGVLQVQGKAWNLSLITFTGGMAGVIFLYLLAENFQIFA